MQYWKKCVLLLLILISFGNGLFAQDIYDQIYPFYMFRSFYGVEHQNDALASMKNPAFAALMEHDGKGALSISYNQWAFYSPLSMGALIPLSDDMDLGFTFNYIDLPVMYGCIVGYGKQQYYNFSSAITYHKVVDISLGFSAKLFHDEYHLIPELGEVYNYYDFDAGMLMQLPLMAATNRGEIELFKRKMNIELTPGFQLVWTNIKQDEYPRWSTFYRASLYDTELQRNIFDILISGNYHFGIKFGLMNLLNFYVENLWDFNGSNIYETELNASQAFRDVYSLIAKKEISKGFFKKSEILISYGIWDLPYNYTPHNINLSLKYNF